MFDETPRYSLTLKRPPLLARAAKVAARSYDRCRDLPVLAPKLMSETPSLDDILDALQEMEARMDQDRRARGVGYSATRHVRILSALMAEARNA